jgi:hypothetical protein
MTSLRKTPSARSSMESQVVDDLQNRLAWRAWVCGRVCDWICTRPMRISPSPPLRSSPGSLTQFTREDVRKALAAPVLSPPMTALDTIRPMSLEVLGCPLSCPRVRFAQHTCTHAHTHTYTHTHTHTHTHTRMRAHARTPSRARPHSPSPITTFAVAVRKKNGKESATSCFRVDKFRMPPQTLKGGTYLRA